ncbi:MAG TPA: PTS sugar transporter subunit IIA [Spirochaetota bacterium]|nr:PTS sugar transporter subunit IIA [Spirochaetota bacterium]HPH02840.1 PTS sugar transporter subunit IIA [Spirochaetota bacterium]
MRLAERIHPAAIACGFLAGGKQEAIAGLVNLLDRAYGPLDQRAIVRAVLNREELISTGVGGGVALPHARADGVRDVLVALGIAASAVDFDAQDGQAVRIFFMIVGPLDRVFQRNQLEVEAKISRLLKSSGFSEALLGCADAEQVLACIRTYEAGIG